MVSECRSNRGQTLPIGLLGCEWIHNAVIDYEGRQFMAGLVFAALFSALLAIEVIAITNWFRYPY